MNNYKYIYEVRFVTLTRTKIMHKHELFWQTTNSSIIISTTEKLIANKIMK